jgi:hypothetical protein
MMEFRIAKGWRFFILLFATFFLAMGILCIYRAFSPSKSGTPTVLFVMGVIVLGVAVLIYRETMMTLLTIDDQSVTLRRSFSNRSLLLTEIEGFKRGEKGALIIVPKDGGKPLRLADSLENKEDLLAWLKRSYPDLDARRMEEETKDILGNEHFGGTMEEREARLKSARKVAGAGVVLSFLLFFWMIFYPKPYELLMLVALAIPLAGIVGVWYFKGLLRLSVKKGSAYPSALFPLMMPVMAAWLGGLREYQLNPVPSAAWRSILLIGVLLGGVIILACREALSVEKNRVIGYIILLVMAGLYSYSAVVFSNCYYDESASVTYGVQVMNKTISRGKSTSYHLQLAPWGVYADGKKVSVSRDLYNNTQIADSVSIYQKPGRWAIPWYRIGR